MITPALWAYLVLLAAAPFGHAMPTHGFLIHNGVQFSPHEPIDIPRYILESQKAWQKIIQAAKNDASQRLAAMQQKLLEIGHQHSYNIFEKEKFQPPVLKFRPSFFKPQPYSKIKPCGGNMFNCFPPPPKTSFSVPLNAIPSPGIILDIKDPCDHLLQDLVLYEACLHRSQLSSQRATVKPSTEPHPTIKAHTYQVFEEQDSKDIKFSLDMKKSSTEKIMSPGIAENPNIDDQNSKTIQEHEMFGFTDGRNYQTAVTESSYVPSTDTETHFDESLNARIGIDTVASPTLKSTSLNNDVEPISRYTPDVTITTAPKIHSPITEAKELLQTKEKLESKIFATPESSGSHTYSFTENHLTSNGTFNNEYSTEPLEKILPENEEEALLSVLTLKPSEARISQLSYVTTLVPLSTPSETSAQNMNMFQDLFSNEFSTEATTKNAIKDILNGETLPISSTDLISDRLEITTLLLASPTNLPQQSEDSISKILPQPSTVLVPFTEFVRTLSTQLPSDDQQQAREEIEYDLSLIEASSTVKSTDYENIITQPTQRYAMDKLAQIVNADYDYLRSTPTLLRERPYFDVQHQKLEQTSTVTSHSELETNGDPINQTHDYKNEEPTINLEPKKENVSVTFLPKNVEGRTEGHYITTEKGESFKEDFRSGIAGLATDYGKGSSVGNREEYASTSSVTEKGELYLNVEDRFLDQSITDAIQTGGMTKSVISSNITSETGSVGPAHTQLKSNENIFSDTTILVTLPITNFVVSTSTFNNNKTNNTDEINNRNKLQMAEVTTVGNVNLATTFDKSNGTLNDYVSNSYLTTTYETVTDNTDLVIEDRYLEQSITAISETDMPTLTGNFNGPSNRREETTSIENIDSDTVSVGIVPTTKSEELGVTNEINNFDHIANKNSIPTNSTSPATNYEMTVDKSSKEIEKYIFSSTFIPHNMYTNTASEETFQKQSVTEHNEAETRPLSTDITTANSRTELNSQSRDITETTNVEIPDEPITLGPEIPKDMSQEVEVTYPGLVENREDSHELQTDTIKDIERSTANVGTEKYINNYEVDYTSTVYDDTTYSTKMDDSDWQDRYLEQPLMLPSQTDDKLTLTAKNINSDDNINEQPHLVDEIVQKTTIYVTTPSSRFAEVVNEVNKVSPHIIEENINSLDEGVLNDTLGFSSSNGSDKNTINDLISEPYLPTTYAEENFDFEVEERFPEQIITTPGPFDEQYILQSFVTNPVSNNEEPTEADLLKELRGEVIPNTTLVGSTSWSQEENATLAGEIIYPSIMENNETFNYDMRENIFNESASSVDNSEGAENQNNHNLNENITNYEITNYSSRQERKYNVLDVEDTFIENTVKNTYETNDPKYNLENVTYYDNAAENNNRPQLREETQQISSFWRTPAFNSYEGAQLNHPYTDINENRQIYYNLRNYTTDKALTSLKMFNYTTGQFKYIPRLNILEKLANQELNTTNETNNARPIITDIKEVTSTDTIEELAEMTSNLTTLNLEVLERTASKEYDYTPGHSKDSIYGAQLHSDQNSGHSFDTFTTEIEPPNLEKATYDENALPLATLNAYLNPLQRKNEDTTQPIRYKRSFNSPDSAGEVSNNGTEGPAKYMSTTIKIHPLIRSRYSNYAFSKDDMKIVRLKLRDMNASLVGEPLYVQTEGNVGELMDGDNTTHNENSEEYFDYDYSEEIESKDLTTKGSENLQYQQYSKNLKSLSSSSSMSQSIKKRSSDPKFGGPGILAHFEANGDDKDESEEDDNDGYDLYDDNNDEWYKERFVYDENPSFSELIELAKIHSERIRVMKLSSSSSTTSKASEI